MFRSNLGLGIAAALVILSFPAANAVAADAGNTKQDLATFLCKDVMRLSGTDRDVALGFAHGYVLGKKGSTEYDVETLSQITSKFIDYCLDHPGENALQSFETLAK